MYNYVFPFFLFAILLTISCSNNEYSNNSPIEKNADDKQKKFLERQRRQIEFKFDTLMDNRDIAKVEISPNVILNWNKAKSSFIKDSLYYNCLLNIFLYRRELVEALTNAETTNLKLCNAGIVLSKGDFALLLLDEVDWIPFGRIFERNFEVSDCGGLESVVIEFLQLDRNTFRYKIEDYYWRQIPNRLVTW